MRARVRVCVCVLCVCVCVCVCVHLEVFTVCLTEAVEVSDALREYQEEKAKYLTRGEMKKKRMLKQEDEV